MGDAGRGGQVIPRETREYVMEVLIGQVLEDGHDINEWAMRGFGCVMRGISMTMEVSDVRGKG